MGAVLMNEGLLIPTPAKEKKSPLNIGPSIFGATSLSSSSSSSGGAKLKLLDLTSGKESKEKQREVLRAEMSLLTNMEVKSARVASYEKRSDKRYWYTLEVVFDVNTELIYRTYEDFYDFQVTLLTVFYNEGGTTKSGEPSTTHKRIIPFLPGQKLFVSESVAKQRRVELDQYVRDLLMLPSYITQSTIVTQFFSQRNEDKNYLANLLKQFGTDQPISQRPSDSIVLGITAPIHGVSAATLKGPIVTVDSAGSSSSSGLIGPRASTPSTASSHSAASLSKSPVATVSLLSASTSPAGNLSPASSLLSTSSSSSSLSVSSSNHSVLSLGASSVVSPAISTPGTRLTNMDGSMNSSSSQASLNVSNTLSPGAIPIKRTSPMGARMPLVSTPSSSVSPEMSTSSVSLSLSTSISSSTTISAPASSLLITLNEKSASEKNERLSVSTSIASSKSGGAKTAPVDHANRGLSMHQDLHEQDQPLPSAHPAGVPGSKVAPWNQPKHLVSQGGVLYVAKPRDTLKATPSPSSANMISAESKSSVVPSIPNPPKKETIAESDHQTLDNSSASSLFLSNEQPGTDSSLPASALSSSPSSSAAKVSLPAPPPGSSGSRSGVNPELTISTNRPIENIEMQASAMETATSLSTAKFFSAVSSASALDVLPSPSPAAFKSPLPSSVPLSAGGDLRSATDSSSSSSETALVSAGASASGGAAGDSEMVKISAANKMYMLKLPRGFSYSILVEKVCQKMGISGLGENVVTFQDDAGDFVTITGDDDLDLAREFAVGGKLVLAVKTF